MAKSRGRAEECLKLPCLRPQFLSSSFPISLSETQTISASEAKTSCFVALMTERDHDGCNRRLSDESDRGMGCEAFSLLAAVMAMSWLVGKRKNRYNCNIFPTGIVWVAMPVVSDRLCLTVQKATWQEHELFQDATLTVQTRSH